MIASPLLWELTGLALCVAELLRPGLFLLWLGLACCATGVADWVLVLSAHRQLMLFVILVPLLVAFGYRRNALRPTANQTDAPGLDVIGHTCRAIDFAGQAGRVTFRDGS